MARIPGTDDDDFLEGTNDADIIEGFGGNDQLFGYDGADTLNGGGDDDVLSPDFYFDLNGNFVPDDGDGDIVDGGAGTDAAELRFDDATDDITADFSDPSVVQNLPYGSQVVNVETVFFVAGTGDDTITGGALADLLAGNLGADTLSGGDGDDYLIPDRDFDDGDGDVVDGGAGTDAAELRFENATEDITADFSDPTVVQNLPYGSQVVNVEAVLLAAGSGADTVTGGALGDFFIGYTGADVLDGGDGNDQLFGGSLGFVGSSDGSADVLIGGLGDDALYGEAGDVLLDGGAGFDFASVSFENAAAGIRFRLGPNSRVATSEGTTTLRGIEVVNIAATAFDDTVVGGAAADALSGSDGDDIIRGLGGGDFIDGGAGNDEISGGTGDDLLFDETGDDTMRGGAGNDSLFSGEGTDIVDGGAGVDFTTISFLNSTAGVDFALTTNVTVDTDAGTKTLRRIEAVQVVGSNFDDTLTGGIGNDLIFGLDGDDILSGRAGDDYIEGGDGDDTVSGGVGNDSLHGISGADTLLGGEGDDFLTGGFDDIGDAIDGGPGDDNLSGSNGDDRLTGASGTDIATGGFGTDIFVYTATSDSRVAAADFIGDFGIIDDVITNGDELIDLSAIDAEIATAADDAFTFIADALFSDVAGELRAFTDPDGIAHVLADVNGDSTADMEILVASYLAPVELQESNFVL